MKWEELPMASRARLMAAAVRNGYTDIRSIKEAYANFQNQKQTTGNRFDKGGDTDEPEVVNLLDKLPIWKALEKIDYTAIPDPEFTREKTGAGSIEYFSAEEPEGITYNNGYHRDHPMPGHDVILYDPNTNDEQDIRLDALHIMPKDPTYDTLNLLYREAARDGDVAWAAKQRYKEDVAKYGKNALDAANMTPQQYFDNEADGLLRNMLIEGSPDYISSKKYYPYKEKLQQWNEHLMPYIDNIQQYLESGERPTWINIDNYQQSRLLPELTVTNQNAYGGNLFGKGSQINNAKPNYNNIGGVQGFLNLLDKKGIKYIKSSGYRPNAKTKSGNASWHSKLDQWGNSQAVDLVFSDFEKARKAIYSDPELVAYLMNNKLGLLEETTSGVLAKTGGTGKHFHLGPDRWALQMRDNAIKQFGATYHPMQDVTWQDVQARRKQFELTPEEETLLNTPALATYNPEYVDRTDPNYRSALAEAVALDESLDAPVNNWEKWNAFLNMQSSQSDPLSQMTTMASLSPNTTPQQKEAANTMYQLFAPQGDDYTYHGLNFAAYGGKVNKFDDGGFSNLPEQRAYRRAVNLNAPYNNYEDAVDLEDSIALRLKKFFDRGISNCTLTASQILDPSNPVGRANTLVTAPRDYNLYEVDESHIVPGTMVIASHPDMSDYNSEQNYHTMVVTGFAPNDYEYTFRDGTKYQIKKGEPLVSYSRGKASADNYVHNVPLSVYNANSKGKTYNRYYRPIDENYPQVMLPEITFTK